MLWRLTASPVLFTKKNRKFRINRKLSKDSFCIENTKFKWKTRLQWKIIAIQLYSFGHSPIKDVKNITSKFTECGARNHKWVRIWFLITIFRHKNAHKITKLKKYFRVPRRSPWEVKLCRIAGPFPSSPLSTMRIPQIFWQPKRMAILD